MKFAEWPVRRIALFWVGMVGLYGVLGIGNAIQGRRDKRNWDAEHPGVAHAVPLDSLSVPQTERDSLRSLLDSSMAGLGQSIAEGTGRTPPRLVWFALGVLLLLALPALVVVGLTLVWAFMRHRARRASLVAAA